ncbi:MAG: nucleotidyl transferase AbiEii/AbiGii toxin family protein [Spirochaetes bacterium]|nr:nucleotidyl transferase AbiEii/AbiGii toxin family protein [Spirochaetota bacterium]
MGDIRLSNHFLVGGTALALYMGHRLSFDLDLFTKEPFDEDSLEEYLVEKYDFIRKTKFKNTLMGEINAIKVDFITHGYKLLEDLRITKEGIRICSLKDIAAMKLSDITGSGTRLKDFVDIAYLSTELSFNDMLNSYERKYETSSSVIAIRALTYFQDINLETNVKMINAKYEWKKIEKRLNDMVKNNNEVFRSPPLNET